MTQQVIDLSRSHRLDSQNFQELLNRFHWRPRGVSWNDATTWARQHR